MDINLDYIYLEKNNSTQTYSNTASNNTRRNNTRRNDTRRNDTNLKKDNKINKNNKQTDENVSKLTNYNFNRMFQSNSYSDFKEKITETLIREYEIPVYEALQNIKRRRGDSKEYEEGLKRRYDELIKLKKDTEKSMFQIRQYLDYIESEKENNKLLPYLIGFESRYKLGEIVIPDILGFSSRERLELKEKYMYFIIFLVKRFLDFSEEDFLFVSIDTLYDVLPKMVAELVNSNELSMKLCEYYNSEPKMKALNNINNYYNLLSDIIDNGKFNLNKLFSDSDTKKINKIKIGGAPHKHKQHKQQNPLSSFSSLAWAAQAAQLSKKFGQGHKFKSLSIYNRDNKKSDSYDKKIKYILKYEKFMVKDQKVDVNKYENLKESLRKNGIAIFIDKLRKDLEDLTLPQTNIPKSTITPPTITKIDEIIAEIQGKKTNSLQYRDKEYINDICIQIKDLQGGKFSKILELCDSTSLSIRDFYTNKEYETNETIRPDEKILQYYYGVRKLYKAYGELYHKYGVKNLPLSSDSKLKQRKIGLNILKGIGNYSSIIRKFLDDSIKRVYMNDVMVRERNRVEKLKREKEERDQRNQREQKDQKDQKEQRDQIDQKNQKETTKNDSKSKKLKKQIAEINREIEKTTNEKIKNKLEKLKIKIIEKHER